MYNYLKARYGNLDYATQKAWDILLQTVYGTGIPATRVKMESPICAKPALDIVRAAPNGDMNSEKNYPFKELWNALEYLQEAGSSIKKKDTYKFDLVDLMRQSMADLAIPLQKQMAAAYINNKPDSFNFYSERFTDLLTDFNTLLGTRKEFLMGKWIADARSIGNTAEEKNYYEKNARALITIWEYNGPNNMLFDYSNREWNRLVGEYYKPRWEQFINMLKGEFKKPRPECFGGKLKLMTYDRPANTADEFYKSLAGWESDWVDTPGKIICTIPSGNEEEVVKYMCHKWVPVASAIYQ